ncbi:MAG: hypothetical protein AB1597_02080 [Chloroflexota bacterium]
MWFWRVIKVVLAIASGIVMAGSLGLDLAGLFPDWRWQWIVLISFFLFVFFIGSIILDLRSQLKEAKSGRPLITLGDQFQINRKLIIHTSQAVFTITIPFKNTGQKVAYETRFAFAWCPEGKPENVRFGGEISCANPIYPSDPQFRMIREFTQRYVTKDGKALIATSGVWICCRLSYSNALRNGKHFSEDYHYICRFVEAQLNGKSTLGALSIADKKRFEPYLQAVFVQRNATIMPSISDNEGPQP